MEATLTAVSTDRIEQRIHLKAPRARVWRALTDPSQFAQWFGLELAGNVAPGEKLSGPLTKATCGHEGVTMEITVETVEPGKRYAFRWHPYAIEPGVDYAGEPTTLIVFTLEDEADGTLLTVVESGFDSIPAARRATAFAMNTRGWAAQLENIQRYLAR